LPLRVDELTVRAVQAAQAREPLRAASEVLNLAAQLAGDCALPAVARALYRRLIETYCKSAPPSIESVSLALEATFGLARLRMRRQGGGLAAWRLIESTYVALRDATDLSVVGSSLPVRALASTVDDLKGLRSWTRAVMLTDGIGGLLLDTSWGEANEAIKWHRGISSYLVECRQIAIISRYFDGCGRQAAVLLDRSRLGPESPEVVVDCLRVFSRLAQQIPATGAADDMVESYIGTDLGQDFEGFQTRCGIAAVGLAAPVSPTLAARACAHLVEQTIVTEDAYSARAVLAAKRRGLDIPGPEERVLVAIVEAAGLGLREGLLSFAEEFRAAVETAFSLLGDTLPARPVNV
jgi:hypothetical protein